MDGMTIFESGAVRGDESKLPRYDLLSPFALERLAIVAREGAKKYGETNWLKGIPIRNLINHAINHLMQFLMRDESEDHLGHALWNIHAAIHMQTVKPEMDDRIRYEQFLPKQ
ncbi:MAG: DUF5664 domain-containing protein [Candidatus Caldarchaeum sp.]